MKKSFFYTIAITTGMLLSVNSTFANSKQHIASYDEQKISRVIPDTPYYALGRISRAAAKADTPYIVVSAAPQDIYAEVERALANEKGEFVIRIEFYSESGRAVRVERYFIRKNDYIR